MQGKNGIRTGKKGTPAGTRRPRERRLCSINDVLARLFDQEEYRRQRFVAALWQNWPEVLGEDLAGLAFPLRHKEDVLVIGAEDAMAMQELALQTPEILERVNAFMGEEVFTRVKLELLLGQRPLRSHIRQVALRAPRVSPIRPPGLGGQAGMVPGSVVGQCYAAYLAMFGIR